MRYVVLALGLLLVLTIAWCVTRKPLSIEEELSKLSPADRQALDALLADTGVTALQLVPITLGTVEHTPLNRHTRAIAIEKARVAALRLVDVPVKRIEAIATLSALRALSLNGNQLTSIAVVRGLSGLEMLDVSRNQIRDLSPIAALPTLKILRISDNRLESLHGLGALNELVEIDISKNQIAELGPLVALPKLQKLNVSANPVTSFPVPLPPRWTMTKDTDQNAAVTQASHPNNWVPALPPRKGKMSNVKMVSQDPSSTWHGTIATLEGAALIQPLVGSTTYAGDRTVELTVNKGRVRAFVQYYPKSDAFFKTPDGFLFAEAEPGKPGSVTGRLQDLTGRAPTNIQDKPWEYQIVLESLDGEAQAITFQIHP